MTTIIDFEVLHSGKQQKDNFSSTQPLNHLIEAFKTFCMNMLLMFDSVSMIYQLKIY